MEKILERIYNDLFDIKKDKDIEGLLERDIINLIFSLSDFKENIDLKKVIEEQNENRIKNYINTDMEDSFFAEKETIHFTYPIQETLNRIEVLYKITGEEKWKGIFGFDFDSLCNFLVIIIFRVLNFNYYKKARDNRFNSKYEKNCTLSLNCYLTFDEIVSFYRKPTEDISRILELLSMDFYSQKEIKDATRLLKLNEKYYIFFISDFLYNLYDILEEKIKDNYESKDKYYDKRGKAFELVCYEKLKEFFPDFDIYKKLNYKKEKGSHEIDLVMKLKNTYVFFECKSSFFDIFKSNSDGKTYSNFKTAFGNGYKTINDVQKYIDNGNNVFYQNGFKDKIEFDFHKCKIVYINLSLYNIEYLQTSVQKVINNPKKIIKIYPICWNYIDFQSIIKLSQPELNLFEKYLNKRFRLINERKNLTFDIDEIDVWGFLTSEEYSNEFEKILAISEKGIDVNFLIKNGIYREQANAILNKLFFEEIV